MDKIVSKIKNGVVATVEKAEQSIYNWHHNGTKQSARSDVRGSPSNQTTLHTDNVQSQNEYSEDPSDDPENSNSLPTTTAQPSNNDPSPAASSEGSLILRNNSNVQLIFQPPGQAVDAPVTSPGAESHGANPGGTFVLEGNKDVQLFLKSGGAAAASSSASGGETIIKGNNKTQMYSSSGVSTDGATGEDQASVEISGNSGSQIMNVPSSASALSSEITNNVGSQIMNIPSVSSEISNNTGSQIMSIPSGETRQYPLPRSVQSVTATGMSHYDFWDVALTKENTVLVAASARGLTEYSLSGAELSHWRPMKPRTDDPEEVVAVASVRDGRAAAGLRNSQLVVLLRRTARKNAAGDGWTEDLRLPKLPSPPWRLSVNADMLAVAMARFDKLENSWRQGRHVQLVRLSDRSHLNRLSPLYDVHSVTLTDELIVTVSYGKVATSSGRRVNVVDAHKLSDCSEQLWRYDRIADDEEIQGVCADSAGNLLYASVLLSNLSCGRVVAISLNDGSELLSHALGFRDPLLPVCLSLGDQSATASGSVTTVLCRDLKSSEWRTVTLQNTSASCCSCRRP